MPGPIDALKRYFAPGGSGTEQSPYAPWQKTGQKALEWSVDGLRGLLGFGDGETGANQTGQLLGAAAPILGGLKRFKFWHDMPELEQIAGGSGPIRTYHGTTEDIAQKILKEGIKLPQSGEAAERAISQRYNIPFPQWQRDAIYTGYRDATKRLSTAPYPVAARWAQHFPQGEINSGLNSQARIMVEANRRGIPYDEMYDIISAQAAAQGERNMFKIPDAAGLPDKMAPASPYGNVLGIDTDVRSLQGVAQREAQYTLDAIAKGELDPLRALKQWNNTYVDMKVAPRNIQNIEVVSRMLRK